MKDFYPQMERRGVFENDIPVFYDNVKRGEAIRYYSHTWSMIHECPRDLEDISDEMESLFEKQNLEINPSNYYLEELGLVEKEVLFFLAKLKKTPHSDYFATFSSAAKK
jgi:hypothetical protein